MSRWAEGREETAVAAVLMLLLMTLRGNVFVYQGEELGLPQAEVPFDRLVDPEAIANWPETLGRDGARTPMPWRAGEPWAGFSTTEPWLPVGPRHPALAVDAQEADPQSMLHLSRRLIGLRRSHVVLRAGAMQVVSSSQTLLVFQRGEGSEALLCAFNLGHGDEEWAAPDGWRVIESVNMEPDSRYLPALGGCVMARI